MLRQAKGDVLVPVGKMFPEGAVVVNGYDKQDRMMVHPLGGGPQSYVFLEYYSKFRSVDPAEKSRALFHQAAFVLADAEQVLWLGEWGALERLGYAAV
jgi:hypothetical protein